METIKTLQEKIDTLDFEIKTLIQHPYLKSEEAIKLLQARRDDMSRALNRLLRRKRIKQILRKKV